MISNINNSSHRITPDSVNIPHELVVEILFKLPVKTLIRCTIVCKLWNSTISDPTFISSHIKNSISRSASYLLRQKPETLSVYIRKNVNQASFVLEKRTEIELPLRFVSLELVNSINGIMYFYCDPVSFGYCGFLYNPSIRKSINLPRPNIAVSSFTDYEKHVIGFGFDAKTNDCKVVRIVYFGDRRDAWPVVELYSLKDGGWKCIVDFPPPCYIAVWLKQEFLNGSIHWVAYRGKPRRNEGKFLLAFDVGHETFKEIELPQSCSLDKPFSVAKFKEWLSVVIHYERELSVSPHTYEIWIMKEYGVGESWTKLYALDLSCRLDRVMGFMDSNNLLLALMKGYVNYQAPGLMHLVLYRPDTGEMDDLRILVDNADSFYMAPYIDNLVLM